MRRSMFQVYVTGSVEAVALYQQAFDAPLVREYKHGDGSYCHAELDVYGQILAVSEADRALVGQQATGNVMQFCLQFGEEGVDKLKQAYELLKDGSRIRFPLGPCDYSSCMVDLVDKFGVCWCLFA